MITADDYICRIASGIGNYSQERINGHYVKIPSTQKNHLLKTLMLKKRLASNPC
jgi:hypothetical protein